MSPKAKGSFIARCEVDIISLRRLMDDCPSKILYEVFALTKRYMLIVLQRYLPSPNVVYKSM